MQKKITVNQKGGEKQMEMTKQKKRSEKTKQKNKAEKTKRKNKAKNRREKNPRSKYAHLLRNL